MPFTFISSFTVDGEYRVPKGTMLFYQHDAQSPPEGFSFVTSGTNRFYACGSNYGVEGGNMEHRHDVVISSIGSAGEHSHNATGESTGCDNSAQIYDRGTSTIALAHHNHTHFLNADAASSASGSHSHSIESSYTGYEGNWPKYKGLRVIKANADNTILPVGAILMSDRFSFSSNKKFALCNGTNGTPDFCGLFVANTPSYNFGGTHNHNHTFPGLLDGGAHGHSYSNSTMAAGVANVEYNPHTAGSFEGSHAHTAEFDLDFSGGHSHSVESTPVGVYTEIVPSINLYFFKYTG